mgnify:CR=1 FL=1
MTVLFYLSFVSSITAQPFDIIVGEKNLPQRGEGRFFPSKRYERNTMTDTIKPLSIESERLMADRTQNLIDAMKAFEDSFAEVQKNEQVIKPNDNNWIYVMNNFTTSMYSRLLERTDWHFEQRNKFKQQAEKVV